MKRFGKKCRFYVVKTFKYYPEDKTYKVICSFEKYEVGDTTVGSLEVVCAKIGKDHAERIVRRMNLASEVMDS